MNGNKSLNIEYIFETSWEVCNKVGGIHTVLSTKAITVAEKIHDNYILIGPDIWRDSNDNPEFAEDPNLFKSWKIKAAEEGIHIRIGRWNISGAPIAVMVDFTSYFEKKDEIFAELWQDYKLDSLSGEWDYVEPVLFGYAAGKVIESFTRYNLTLRENIVAHFHEWMTGSGILYLKKYAPYISTAFTTHATVLGRSISGNGLPLYGMIEEFKSEKMAKEFNVIAKQSLEQISAKESDVFMSVSNITSKECKHFLEKNPDFVTPNGFEDTFVPHNTLFEEKRDKAKNKLREVSEALLGYQLSDDVIFVSTSGRYEFKNKGYDIFVDALGKLRESDNIKREIVAFVAVPANHSGPRKSLLEKLNGNKEIYIEKKILTHGLHDREYDPILNHIEKNDFKNEKDDKVKIIYIPTYLNGFDGVFNMSYFDILIGMDLTVFPSYYEPWGYTPLESVAFHIPTITTSLAGFGLWYKSKFKGETPGVTVIERSDNNDKFVISEIIEKIEYFSSLSFEKIEEFRDGAYQVSRSALWDNFINYYFKAYEFALNKSKDRRSDISKIIHLVQPTEYAKPLVSCEPLWNRVVVETKIPKSLSVLKTISHNLWWSWRCDATVIFEKIDKELWIKSECNPIIMLDEVPYERLLELEKDNEFMKLLTSLDNEFKKYLENKNKSSYKIAYFSMEFGIHDSVKIFSGGLGILAGDYLKEASDSNVDIVGIGLLYRFGYFKQHIALHGEQIPEYSAQKYAGMPIEPVKDVNGDWMLISIAFPGRMVKCRIWSLAVGRVTLYLLDTDFEDNSDGDRTITHKLYGGDLENRIKQEIVLGIGGVKLLKKLDIKPNLYHCNEGHAAFSGLERISDLTNIEKLSFEESIEVVKSSTLFTTHTPVPAGHDAFSEDMMRKYFLHYPKTLSISWSDFISLGKENSEDNSGKFSMSYLAINISGEVNGVSKLHGEVTKTLFQNMWKGYVEDESHIGFVTNGVHFPSWASNDWCNLYRKYFGEEYIYDQSNTKYWEKIKNVPDKEIWETKSNLRYKLIDFVKDRYKRNRMEKNENPRSYFEIVSKLNKEALTFGFARRFATYKRANLLFQDMERLARIVNISEKPVQFLFAGKAHPNDGGGQDLIKYVFTMSQRPEFKGKILFLENYDIELAKQLIQGVDVWINTPTRPLEASGTSGMKAVMNGTLQLSVLDGWYVEGYKPNAGWALTEKKSFQNQDLQNELDAEELYDIIENEIIPIFYNRDENGISSEWISFVKNCIAGIAPHFTTKRMIDDYIERFYKKLYKRNKLIIENNFQRAKKLSSWKKRIMRGWESIVILKKPNISTYCKNLKIGESFVDEIVLDLKELSIDDIGVELVIAERDETNKVRILEKKELEIKEVNGKIITYSLNLVPVKSGALNFGLRIFPVNSNLQYRQDFAYVKWIK